MTEAPAFFVPAATPDTRESIYAELAQMCMRPVPKPAHRIYSMRFGKGEDEEWIATVGETLAGVHHKFTRSRGKTAELKLLLGDPAVVLAIFPGDPYMVVTNQNLPSSVGSAWENPFLVGESEIRNKTYFAIS